MAQMKLIVQGTPEVDCSPEAVHQLVSTIIQEDILYELARSIRLLPFEARKDAQIIFSHILRFKPANASTGDPSAISYLVMQRPEIIVELCRGYEDPKSAMPCGTILRQALQHDTIAAVILYDESKPGERAVQLKVVDVGEKQTGQGLVWNFFQWINKGSFEVSADAFTTFRVRFACLVSGNTDIDRKSSQNTSNSLRNISRPISTCSSRSTTIQSYSIPHPTSQNGSLSNCLEKSCSTAATTS